jgi:protoporphyrinogen oxidase
MARVIVLGGGIAGLAAAHRLAERGAEVVVLEAADRLGGLGGTFDYGGRRYERFYHTLSSADTALLQLMADAGLREQCEWQKTTMGMVVDAEHYDFTSPMDLLRFTPLSLFQRLRLGVGGKSLRYLGRGKDLDSMSAEDWMRPIFGDDAWEKVWRPMFTMKFGGATVPALYLYERLARESNVALRAYPACGYQGIADGIAASIERMGGKVVTNARVRSLELRGDQLVVTTDDERFDAPWAVSTFPMPLLRAVATGTLADELNLPDLQYMGVINVLYLLNRPLSGHYWSAIIDSETDFSGMIEISTLTGTEHFQGHHAVYVMRYTDRSSAIYQESDEAIEQRWTEQFLRLHQLDAGDIDRAFVFRTPFVEPVWPLGYSRIKPPPRIGDTPLFMATTAQAYPQVTSWDAATRTAEATVAAMEPVI